MNFTYKILVEVNLTSKMLQNRDVGLNAYARQLQAAKSLLERCRLDEGFEQTSVGATEVAKELESPSSFEQELVRRKWKRQRDEQKDETAKRTSTDPKQKFRIYFYFAVLYMAIQPINERFVQLQ